MFTKFNYLILIFFWSILCTLKGQSQNITTLSTSDGLSEGLVFDILTDQEGFMWFSTRNGLNRYDGYSFKVYRHNSFDSLSISGNGVLKIFEDSRGRLWSGTFRSGLNCFDKKTGKFYRFRIGDKNVPVQPFIFSIEEDTDGIIWIGGWKGALYSIHTGEHDFDFSIKKHHIETIKDKSVTFLSNYVLSDGTFIIGTLTKGIFKWNKQTKQFVPFELPDSKVLTNIISFLEYPKGTLWIGTKRQLFRLKNDKLDAVPTPIAIQQKVPTLEERMIVKRNPKNNQLWISYFSNIIYELDPISEDFALQPAVQLEDKIGITEIYFDKNEIAWLGTDGHGVRKIKQQQYAFRHLAKGKYIQFVYQTKNGEIYIHANRKMLVAPESTATFIPLSEYTNIPTDAILGIKETSNGELWAVTRWFQQISDKAKLFRLGADREVKEVLKLPPVDMLYGRMIEDDDGNLWLPSLEKDFTKLNTETLNFESFGCFKDKNMNLDYEAKTTLYKDGQGNYWMTALNGLYRFNIDSKGKITDCKLYQNNPKDLKSLSFNSLSSVVDDPIAPEKYLWVGTRGGGLNRMDKVAETFEHFGEEDGLPSDVVLGLLSDDMGNLWFSTNKGLSKYNPSTQEIITFSVVNGLQDNEFAVSSFYKNEKTGELFFGGINGITAFYPKDIHLNTFEPKVHINQLKINGELIELGKPLKQQGENPLTQSIEFTKKIRLPWYQNQITLNFASLDFANPERNLYQYKLSSIDKEWVNSGNRHSVNYTNLTTGTHIFQLRGTNSDGIWSSEEAHLEIVIYPPWYRTYWAYTLYVILFIFGVYKLYQDQVRRAKLHNELEFEQKEAARLAEIDKIKTNFFSNITHEFRTPLTLIIEPLRQIIQNPRQNWLPKVELAKVNSERLLNLINQLLDLSKLESNKMTLELKRGQITEVIQPIIQSFQLLAKRKDIELIYKEPKAMDYFDFDKDKIEKVLFNLISNAIKFTPKNGQIAVNITETNIDNQRYLQMIVKDTGIGIGTAQQQKVFDRFYQIDASQTRTRQGTGIGLSLTKELIEVMNGTITLDSAVGKGTSFTVVIPMVFLDSITNETSPNQITDVETFIPIGAAIAPISEDKVIALDATNVVLLIEDNDELRQFIRMSIEDKYQVMEANNGKTGLELARKHIPNVIISDVMMPQMNGFDLCKTIKTTEETAHIPLILLTAKAALDSKIKGLKYGADAYMSKPFNTEELRVRIKNLIENRQRLQAKFSQTIEAIQPSVAPTEKEQPSPSFLTDHELSPFDQSFLNKVNQVIQTNLDNENLSVGLLAKEIRLSRGQLHRKIKGLLNQSPSELIRNIRLKEAMQLLQQRKGNVTEVSYSVGFSNPKYFSTKFKEKYGVTPSQV